MECVGGVADHCCHLGPVGVCTFLDTNVDGRRWSCRLRAELGDWSKVHDDVRYVTVVQPTVRALVGVDCGDWPPPGVQCATCGGVDGWQRCPH